MKEKGQNSKTKDKEESEGAAESVLHSLGQIIPGLGGIIEGLERSDAIQQRLSTINKEIERQLREAPFKEVGQDGVRRTIIPPRTTLRNLQPASRIETPPLKKQREVTVDIFDEGDYIKIIAELPGLAEEDIRTEVMGSILTISATGISREYYKEVTLPCPVKGELDSSYRNGVLQLKAEKN